MRAAEPGARSASAFLVFWKPEEPAPPTDAIGPAVAALPSDGPQGGRPAHIGGGGGTGGGRLGGMGRGGRGGPGGPGAGDTRMKPADPLKVWTTVELAPIVR
ncbi:MAG: hypothetical protein ACT4QD_01550 [Acidobacteriota bacterium]